MGIFNIFLPKENKFISLLNQQVAKVKEAADMLVIFMSTKENGPEREELNIKIKHIETEADNIYDSIFEELNTSFITPFDREDIQELASKLDDVVDFIHGVAKRTIMFNIKDTPESFVVLAQIIQKQCTSLQISLKGFDKVSKNPKSVKAECQRIHELETQADEEYARFVTKLFAECKDPIELVKQNEIIQYLEDATDKTDDVADVIRTIIVKYN